jgi:polyhydroxyalkanoate synthesis regulator phasin
MVRDALSNYLTFASGLTEVTRQRARAVAKALVSQSGATVGQVSSLAEELLQTSRANRAALVSLVRYEVEHAFGRLGLASTEEVAALRQRVADLEQAFRQQSDTANGANRATGATGATGAVEASPGSPPEKAPGKAESAKKAGTAKKTATPATTAAPEAGGDTEEQE